MYVNIYVYIHGLYAKKAYLCAVKYHLKNHLWSCHTFGKHGLILREKKVEDDLLNFLLSLTPYLFFILPSGWF